MTELGPKDRYRRLDLLGRGGMGEVLLADDLLLKRKVAIKIVHRSSLLNPRSEKLLRREAKAAAALDNPFICKVYEVGEFGGRRLGPPQGVIELVRLLGRARAGERDLDCRDEVGGMVVGDDPRGQLACGERLVAEALDEFVGELLGFDRHGAGHTHTVLKPRNLRNLRNRSNEPGCSADGGERAPRP